MAIFARPRRRAVVASATRLTASSSQTEKQASEHWQSQALSYYDKIGELRYASQFYARQLSRVRIYPARLSDDGQTEPITSGAPVELLNRIQDAGGGRARLQYDYGRLMFITGEGALFISEAGPAKFLWKEEIKIDDRTGIAQRKRQDGTVAELGTAYRMWTPHPRQSDRADAPMRAVLDIAEELLLLTASVRATAVSRLTNGFLIIPSELSLPGMDEEGDEDAEANPFLKKLTEHIQAQIDDPGSAKGRVPFLLEAAAEYITPDFLRWMQTHDSATDFMERDLRLEAIKRLALGLDMPPEVLLGMTDANHWTAKQVQHDMWRSHGVAKATQWCSDLNEAYLKPALEQEGYADLDRVIIAFDDSAVVVSPDQTEDADNALDRAAISFKGYRELKGIPESMAPSTDEQNLLILLRTRRPDLIGVDTPQRGPLPQNGSKPDAQNGPPSPSAGRPVSRPEARTAAILGAAALALRQSRAKAGARLRSQQGNCDECQEKTDGQPNSVVAAALGWDQVQELGAKDPLALVKGGTDEFRGILFEWGFDPIQASALCQRLEAYAARTLFERQQPDLPPGFIGYVEEGFDAVEH